MCVQFRLKAFAFTSIKAYTYTERSKRMWVLWHACLNGKNKVNAENEPKCEFMSKFESTLKHLYSLLGIHIHTNQVIQFFLLAKMKY